MGIGVRLIEAGALRVFTLSMTYEVDNLQVRREGGAASEGRGARGEERGGRIEEREGIDGKRGGLRGKRGRKDCKEGE